MVPTSELPSDTTASRPTVPSTQVAAPTPFQTVLDTTKLLPPPTTVTPPLPTSSLEMLPLSALINVPSGLYRNTAPFLSGAVTTKLPLDNTTTCVPNEESNGSLISTCAALANATNASAAAPTQQRARARELSLSTDTGRTSN